MYLQDQKWSEQNIENFWPNPKYLNPEHMASLHKNVTFKLKYDFQTYYLLAT